MDSFSVDQRKTINKHKRIRHTNNHNFIEELNRVEYVENKVEDNHYAVDALDDNR